MHRRKKGSLRSRPSRPLCWSCRGFLGADEGTEVLCSGRMQKMCAGCAQYRLEGGKGTPPASFVASLNSKGFSCLQSSPLLQQLGQQRQRQDHLDKNGSAVPSPVSLRHSGQSPSLRGHKKLVFGGEKGGSMGEGNEEEQGSQEEIY